MLLWWSSSCNRKLSLCNCCRCLRAVLQSSPLHIQNTLIWWLTLVMNFGAASYERTLFSWTYALCYFIFITTSSRLNQKTQRLSQSIFEITSRQMWSTMNNEFCMLWVLLNLQFHQKILVRMTKSLVFQMFVTHIMRMWQNFLTFSLLPWVNCLCLEAQSASRNPIICKNYHDHDHEIALTFGSDQHIL